MADHSETEQLGKRLKSASKRLHDLTGQVGAAKQIREYDSDRRKNLLAKFVAKELKAGATATAAESYARSDAVYQQELQSLSEQYTQAEVVIAQWTSEQCSFEAARSLLSFSRETIRQL